MPISRGALYGDRTCLGRGRVETDPDGGGGLVKRTPPRFATPDRNPMGPIAWSTMRRTDPGLRPRYARGPCLKFARVGVYSGGRACLGNLHVSWKTTFLIGHGKWTIPQRVRKPYRCGWNDHECGHHSPAVSALEVRPALDELPSTPKTDVESHNIRLGLTVKSVRFSYSC